MSLIQGFENGVNTGIRLFQAKEAEDQRSALEAANKAARDAMQAHRDQYEANLPKPEQRLTYKTDQPQPGGLQLQPTADAPRMPQLSLNGQGVQGPGAEMTLGLQSQPSSADVETVKPRTPKYDEREGVLAGLTARRKSLMDSGAGMDVWGKAWVDEQGARSELRKGALERAQLAYQTTGDFGAFAKIAYPLINDGMDIVDVKPAKLPDGSDGWEMIRRDESTGKDVSSTISQQKAGILAATAANPTKLAEYELKAAIANAQASAWLARSKGSQVDKRETNAARHDATMAEIAARGGQARLTASTRGSETRKTNDAKPVTLGADATLVKPDGNGGYTEAARGAPRTPGQAPNPSAPNRILLLRQESQAAISKGADPKKVAERFRALTGKDF